LHGQDGINLAGMLHCWKRDSDPRSGWRYIEGIGWWRRIVEGVGRVRRDRNSRREKKAPKEEAITSESWVKEPRVPKEARVDKARMEELRVPEKAGMNEARPGEESGVTEAGTRREAHRLATMKTSGGCLTDERH
jgi:hypothetical protein